MIVEYLRYSIPASQRGDFVKNYDAACVALVRSPFAVSLDLCQCVDTRSEFILRIE